MKGRRHYLLENEVDEGLPQDWGDPEEDTPGVLEYLKPAWGFGNWRFVIVELTADERVALTRLAHVQDRDTNDMAAALIRRALREPPPERKQQPARDPFREDELNALCERLRRMHAQR